MATGRIDWKAKFTRKDNMEQKYYVYKWFIESTEEVFYIGKGCGDRYKDTYKRNQIFKQEYLNIFSDCKSEIIKYFDTEDEAFQYEEKLITYYRSLGQAKANIDKGGAGGYKSQWTPELRAYMSKYNPMKDPEIAKKSVANRHKRAIKYKDKIYECASELVPILGVSLSKVCEYAKRGYDGSYNLCQYLDTEYKPIDKHKQFLNPASKGVIIDNEKMFDTLQDAAKYIGGNAQSLGRALKKGQTTFKGHTCKYANQQPSQENSQ